jgi:hypothetical protein
MSVESVAILGSCLLKALTNVELCSCRCCRGDECCGGSWFGHGRVGKDERMSYDRYVIEPEHHGRFD